LTVQQKSQSFIQILTIYIIQNGTKAKALVSYKDTSISLIE